MSFFNGFGELLRGKVGGSGAHAEAPTGQIDRVGAVSQRVFKALGIACGSQYFGLSHHQPYCAHCDWKSE